MSGPGLPLGERLLISWINLVEKNKITVIAGILCFTFLSVYYIKNNLGMSTATADMLSEELPWRKLDIEYEKLFPRFLDNLLIVVESETADEANDNAVKLYHSLKSEPSLIYDIYYPGVIPYFRNSAFLFMEQHELQDLADRLAEIQPFLGTLTEDKNLRGLFKMLTDAINAKQDGEAIDLNPLLTEINHAFDNAAYKVSWQRLMSIDKKQKSIYREFIMLQVSESATETLPGEHVISHIRKKIDAAGLLDNNNIKVRLTGGTALSYEELKSVTETNIRAVVISFVLVGIILIVGLGSAWLVFSCLLTLLTGLIATTAFATATVGELNLISVAFAVLYIGLGIDFAIHLTLRYREMKLTAAGDTNALQLAIPLIFRSLILCGFTTAIGFYSFIPTDYRGVAELGWIAGSGMFISIIFTFTLLPALIGLKDDKPKAIRSYRLLDKILRFLSELPYRFSNSILFVSLLITVFIVSQINKINFDTNTLNLQNPENESVKTYRDLLKDSATSPWKSILLIKGKENARRAKHELEALSLVDNVVWIEDLIATDQEEKLFIIDEMSLMMGSVPTGSINKPIDKAARLQSMVLLRQAIEEYTENHSDAGLKKLLINLNDFLNKNPRGNHLADLENQLLLNLDGRLASLADALNAKPTGLTDVPETIRVRWTNDDYFRLRISPRENLNDNSARRRFVEQLQTYDNKVIGSPVISIEAGKAVITAFKSAFSYALAAIAILLLILIRVKTDAIIILIAVLTGAIFTCGFMLLFNIPLNFANIIGLPLLLGIGVDSGIHIADRFRQEQKTSKNIFMTSSSRGVMVSALTTICSIGNLAFSAHVGTADMGLLLTTGLVSMMIATLLILPAMLIRQTSMSGRES